MTTENPLNKDPITQEPGAHPLGTGLGAGSGALAGAAVGTLVAGPFGTLAGGMIGAISGGLAGKEIAEATNPTLGGDEDDNVVGQGVGASAGVMAGAVLGSTLGPVGTLVGAGIGAAIGGVAGNSVEEMMDSDDKTLNQNHTGIHSTKAIPTTATVTTTQTVQHNELRDMSSTELDNVHKTELHRLPEAAMTDNSNHLTSSHTTTSHQSNQNLYTTDKGNLQSDSGLGNSQYAGFNSGNSQSSSGQYPVGSQSSTSINNTSGSLSNPESVDPKSTLGQTVTKHPIYKDTI